MAQERVRDAAEAGVEIEDEAEDVDADRGRRSGRSRCTFYCILLHPRQ